MNALEKFELDEMEQIKEELEQSRFKVDSLEAANWCFRKLAVLEKQQSEIDALAQKEIERIQNWQQSEKKKIDFSKQFFECLLEEYFRSEREKNPKFKLSTPYGKVSSRKQQPKWTYDDEKLLNYLESAGLKDFIRIKKEVDKAALKKAVEVVNGQAVTEDGEIIDGITIEEQPEKIIIKPEVE